MFAFLFYLQSAVTSQVGTCSGIPLDDAKVRRILFLCTHGFTNCSEKLRTFTEFLCNILGTSIFSFDFAFIIQKELAAAQARAFLPVGMSLEDFVQGSNARLAARTTEAAWCHAADWLGECCTEVTNPPKFPPRSCVIR